MPRYGVSVRSQTITSFDPQSVLVELLNSIKSVVESDRYRNPTEAYKTVSIGLTQCAAAYQISSENRSDVSAFARAGAELCPGETENSKDVSRHILSDRSFSS